MMDKLSPKTILVIGIFAGYHLGRHYDVKFLMRKVGK
jgi:hypothetical protein